MSLESRCMEALESVKHSDTLKLAVIKNKPRETFEALGGTEDIYYDIKGWWNHVGGEFVDYLRRF